MRIKWNPEMSEFQAEISLTNDGWRDDVDILKQSGFHTSGPPQWAWLTTKVSVLNKLRDLKPKSGLAITELALEKYKFLTDQQTQKAQLKKQFEQAKKQAAEEIDSAKWRDYIDEETGIVCKQVEPLDTKFVWKYTPPPAPEVWCFICGDALYFMDYPDLCLWCSNK